MIENARVSLRILTAASPQQRGRLRLIGSRGKAVVCGDREKLIWRLLRARRIQLHAERGLSALSHAADSRREAELRRALAHAVARTHEALGALRNHVYAHRCFPGEAERERLLRHELR